MKLIEQYTQLIGQELDKLQLGDAPSNLYEPMHYILKLGGKRLRPAMVLAGCELFGGDKLDALKPALGIELFHNFSLIHDDIMDKAPLRRGKKTVHKEWNKNIGILSGDGMLVKAYQYVAEVNPQILPQVLATFNKTAIEVCEGQQYDMDFETQENVSEDEYIEMIRLKTSVLLGAALKIGATIAGADEENQERIYQFGVNIGIAFQIQDDLLDSFGDPEKFGKTVGGDIMNNKQTLLMIATKGLADKDERLTLASIDQLNLENKVDAVKEIFEISGAKAYTEAKRDAYFEKSLEYLSSIESKHAIKHELGYFAKYLVQRET